MPSPPLRIAILECDTPLDNTRARYEGYGGVFKQMLGRGADGLGHPGLSSTEGLELKCYNVERQEYYPRLEDIDAILITGSSMLDNEVVSRYALTRPLRTQCLR
jgi:hypothetical protein